MEDPRFAGCRITLRTPVGMILRGLHRRVGLREDRLNAEFTQHAGDEMYQLVAGRLQPGMVGRGGPTCIVLE